ncbi:M6 family metalloprotease domain-containing protein [bacterium]|nr:M6 family metalloprotease domain-containing protein [candidate division CSSED10-310 bacterium]
MHSRRCISAWALPVLTVFLLLNAAEAAPPIPGTYNPETLTFYATGERIPLFYDEPGPMREKSAYRGVWNFPVIFIETPDVAHTYSVSDWAQQLFTLNIFTTGSMRDYYREISYQNFDIDGITLGWIMADYNYEHYHQNNYGFDGGAAEMAREAVMKAETQFNPDWSQFDNDGDGKVDGVLVIHMGAGGEGGTANQIWSHVSSFPKLEYDGVEISKYSIQPETRTNGDMETIGTICHEHGHILGLPDLYDINYTGKPDPVGRYCLMASGSSGGNPMGCKPAHMSAWCKAQLGWITPTVIEQAGTYTIDAVQVYPNQNSYILEIKDSNEYFLLANRWMDAPLKFEGLPTRFVGGLMVYHVDETFSWSNDGRTDYWHVVLEDATPGDNHDLANGGFGAGVNSEFGRFTDPNSDGNLHPSGVSVYNISAQGEHMSFSVRFSPVFQLRDYSLRSLGGNQFALYVTIENIAHVPSEDLMLTASTSASNVSFVNSEVDVGSFLGYEKKIVTAPFIFETTSSDSGFAEFTITASGSTFQGKAIPFDIPVNPARILIVDDDATKGADGNLEQYWIEGLGSLGITHQLWSVWDDGFPMNGMLDTYDLVIWCDGDSTNAVPKRDGNGLELIEEYLDRGGDMIWSSHEFLFAEYGMPLDQDHIVTEPGDFAREYLHILELEHDEYFYHAYGVPGTLTEGMTLELIDVLSTDPTGATSGGYNWWPDEFITDNTCIPILTAGNHEWPYSTTPPDYWTEDQQENILTNATCAMLYQGQHRIMFMSAPLHGITTDPAASPNTRQQFLNKILKWFGVTLTTPGLDIDVNDPMIAAGETCHVTLKVSNPDSARSVNVFIAMEAYGLWLFGPTWTETANYYPMNLQAGDSMVVDVFPAFPWPSGVGSGTVTMWTVMLDSGSGMMLGNYDFTPLSWN